MDVIIQQLASASSASPTDASALEASISALKSCISALESSINTLGSSSNSWEKFGWCCAVAVGLGVGGEIVVIIWEFIEDRHAWRRGIVRPPDHPSIGRFWFDIIATVIVLVGIFLEAGASSKVSSINSRLRSDTSELSAKSDQLLGLITREAGDAVQSARSAHQQLDVVKKEAKYINNELTFAQRTLGARHVLDDADLEKRLAKDFKGKVIIFKSYVDDTEAFMVCSQLWTDANKPEVGVSAVNECADEPLPPHLPISDLMVTAPTIEEASRLAMDVGRQDVVIQGINLGVSSQMTVLVGKLEIRPLFWPKTPKGKSKAQKK